MDEGGTQGVFVAPVVEHKRILIVEEILVSVVLLVALPVLAHCNAVISLQTP